MASWSEFHSDPRKSYYLFLRQGYACSARAAHLRVKQIDSMVVGLQCSKEDAAAISRLASLTYLLGVFSAAQISLKQVWANLSARRMAAS
jgi:hypothetical protein